MFSSSKTQQHVSNVYSILASGIILSGIGTYLGSYGIIPIGLIIAGLFINFICEIIYLFTRNSKFSRDYISKYSYYGMTLLLGALLGSTLSELTPKEISVIKPFLISSFIITSTIFVSISIISFLTVRRVAIFFGALMTTIILSIITIFLAPGHVEAVLGLIIGCMYVLIDTQLMIHKAEGGILEPYEDARQLFYDFVKIFIELLKLLGKKKED